MRLKGLAAERESVGILGATRPGNASASASACLPRSSSKWRLCSD
jgi:hypothetical protein